VLWSFGFTDPFKRALDVVTLVAAEETAPGWFPDGEPRIDRADALLTRARAPTPTSAMARRRRRFMIP
jgi:hypothetical protein